RNRGFTTRSKRCGRPSRSSREADMSNHPSDKLRVKQLIAQDPEINPNRMKEVRMQLEQTLASSEAKAVQMRRRIVVALGVYWGAMGIVFYTLSLLGNVTGNPKLEMLKQFILAPVAFSGLVAFVILLLLIPLYLFKYWPRLNRTRYDVHTAMMLEL